MLLDDRTANLVRWSIDGQHDRVAAEVSMIDDPHDRGNVLCEAVSLAGAAIVALASQAGIDPAGVLAAVTADPHSADVIPMRRR